MCGGVKMGCIMTPMPNHLSTLNHTEKCGEHTPKNHAKQCGKGSDVEQMRRMDEMERIKVEKG